MFFKPSAEKLMRALDEAMEGPEFSVEKLSRFKKAEERLKEAGRKWPREFLPFLCEERAGSIGDWIAGSGEEGLEALRDVIEGANVERASWAVRALWEFEKQAASEVPMLIELLGHHDGRMRRNAAHCLGRIGPGAVSGGGALTRVAMDGSEDERRSAFFALERIGYDIAIVTEICLEAMSEGGEIRGVALETFNCIGADANRAFEWIVKELESSDGKSLESAAIELIEKCDLSEEQRRRAVAALEGLIVKDPPNRPKSMSALWRLDRSNVVLMGAVGKDLRSDECEMESACDVICAMKEGGAPFVGLLIQQLEKHQEYWDFCWAAVDALGEIGSEAGSARGILERMKSHSSELVRKRVAEALTKIG